MKKWRFESNQIWVITTQNVGCGFLWNWYKNGSTLELYSREVNKAQRLPTIHSLFLALLDLFFLGPKPTSHKPQFGTEQTAGLRPTDSVLQLCEAVVKEMGEKSGSVVSHSLIFQSQASAESVGDWGGGCVTFFLGGNTGRWEGFLAKQNKKTCKHATPSSILAFFYIFFWLWWGNPRVFVEHKNPSFFFLEGYFSSKGHLWKNPSFFQEEKNHDTSKGPNSDCFYKKFRGINSSTPSCGFEKFPIS